VNGHTTDNDTRIKQIERRFFELRADLPRGRIPPEMLRELGQLEQNLGEAHRRLDSARR